MFRKLLLKIKRLAQLRTHHLRYLAFTLLAIFFSQLCLSKSQTVPAAYDYATLIQYHHVNNKTPAITSVTTQKFEQHLELIETLDFQVLPLASIISSIQNNTDFSKKTLAITFDDAYASIYENAFPLLKKRNWPFTIFVNPKAIDDGHSLQLSWEMLKEMQSYGATIVNHSNEHNHLLKKLDGENKSQWLERTKKDIQLAQARLEEKLNIQHKWLAYPYGEFDNELQTLLAQMGFLGFSQQSGAINKSTDMLAIPRFPASGIYANTKTLKTKLLSKPFYVKGQKPEYKIRSVTEKAPKLELTVNKHDINHRYIQCYFSGNKIETHKKISDQQLTISTHFDGHLPRGRSRYNCTAPSLSQKIYYWYSMPFITLENNKWLD